MDATLMTLQDINAIVGHDLLDLIVNEFSNYDLESVGYIEDLSAAVKRITRERIRPRPKVNIFDYERDMVDWSNFWVFKHEWRVKYEILKFRLSRTNDYGSKTYNNNKCLDMKNTWNNDGPYKNYGKRERGPSNGYFYKRQRFDGGDIKQNEKIEEQKREHIQDERPFKKQLSSQIVVTVIPDHRKRGVEPPP